MLKILFATDLHMRATKPASRKDDDFLGTIVAKIDYICSMSENFDIVILGGDLFDRPDVSPGVVVRAINAFKKFKVPIYSIIGQHDIWGYNGTTVEKTSLGIMLEDGVIKKLDYIKVNGVNIYGLHAYDETVWEVPNDPGPKVLVAHKFLTNNPIPGEHFYLISDVAKQTNADLILSGDIHYPHDVEENGKLFLNPGSLTRKSIIDRNRVPQVAEIEIADDGTINYNMHAIPTRPADVLFDLENYSYRLACELHTKENAKTFAHVVLSVKGEAHKVMDMLVEFMENNGVGVEVQKMEKSYYDRAERERLQELKD